MKVSLSTKVWNTIISPKDRTLKNELNMYHNSNKIEVKLFEVPNGKKKSSYCSKYYLARSSANKNVSNEKRKLAVVFPGRNFNFFQIGNTFYAQKLYKTSRVDEFDIAIIIYPAKSRNLDQLAESCVFALKQLISDQHGYSASNLSILGWCLGGYFATETLRRFVALNPNLSESFRCFINNKSFSSVHDFLYFILPKYIRPVLKLWVVKKYVKKWNSDSSRSLDEFDDVFKSIYVVYTDSDRIVNGLSHFYKNVSEKIENVEIIEDIERTDHFCNWNLLAEILESESREM